MMKPPSGNPAPPTLTQDCGGQRVGLHDLLARRTVITALGAGALIPHLSLGGGWGWMGQARADAIPPANRIPFTVFRGGSEIGHHIVTFTPDGDDLTVDIEIDLSVSIAFITAYSYSHRNREVWSGGRLISLETSTDDDGSSHFVRARAENGEIQVESSSGSYSAPADAIPSSYWNRAFLDRDRIINTQDGQFMEVVIDSSREETIEAAGRQIAATRYEIGGFAPLTIWYSDAGQWVKLAFDGQGSQVSYALVAGDGASTLANG